MRIVTFFPDNGGLIAQAAILFPGRAGRTVNSWPDGVISTHIDLSTGVLGTGRPLPKHGRDPPRAHPDTGTAFEGVVLPDWRRARKLALRASRLTLGMRHPADSAITYRSVQKNTRPGSGDSRTS